MYGWEEEWDDGEGEKGLCVVRMQSQIVQDGQFTNQLTATLNTEHMLEEQTNFNSSESRQKAALKSAISP